MMTTNMKAWDGHSVRQGACRIYQPTETETLIRIDATWAQVARCKMSPEHRMICVAFFFGGAQVKQPCYPTCVE